MAGEPRQPRPAGWFWWLVRWSSSADVRSLAEGERYILEGPAALLGLGFQGGWFLLGEKRLIYMPSRPRYLPAFLRRAPTIEIEVSEIVALTKRRWLRGLWGGLPGCRPFRVELRDGRTYTFQATPSTVWRREIAKAAGLPAEAGEAG